MLDNSVYGIIPYTLYWNITFFNKLLVELL